MKRFLLGLLLLASWSPYLFLATSVERLDSDHRAYNCTIKSSAIIDEKVGVSAGYYTPIRNQAMLEGRFIILPYFFNKQDVLIASCGDAGEFALGGSSQSKINDQIHVYTQPAVLKFFNHEIYREKDISMYGTGWTGKAEGETVMTRLVNGKEVKFFHGVPVPECNKKECKR